MTTGRSDEVIDANGLRLPGRFTPDRALAQFRAEPGGRYVLADLEGPGCIRHLWMTTRALPGINRSMILRLYWDGATVPAVEAPLGDFFGMCHGVGYYPINNQFLSVQDQSGYNAYFAMPFERGARLELEVAPDAPARPLYYHVDWHRYRPGALREPLRFHAAWRRENPTQAYGEEYLVLDAVGRGRLLGFVYGVRLLDDADRWSHGGAENLYLDGEAIGEEGVEPAYLRGSGGEDTFGTSYGGALHRPETHLYAGIPYYTHEDVGQARPAQRLGAYRFFVPDAIPFERSLHFRFGCVANDICSTVYWYQTAPHRPFVRLPGWDRLQPGTELRRGSVDLLAAGGRRRRRVVAVRAVRGRHRTGDGPGAAPGGGRGAGRGGALRRRLRSGVALAYPEPGQARAAPGALGAAARRARLRRLRPRLPPLDARGQRAVAGGGLRRDRPVGGRRHPGDAAPGLGRPAHPAPERRPAGRPWGAVRIPAPRRSGPPAGGAQPPRAQAQQHQRADLGRLVLQLPGGAAGRAGARPRRAAGGGPRGGARYHLRIDLPIVSD